MGSMVSTVIANLHIERVIGAIDILPAKDLETLCI